jgi:hypothetical protein
MSVGVVLDRCTMSHVEPFDWSTVEVIAASSHHLEGFIREMYDANSGFLHNMSVLYDGFAAGRLFGLRLAENEVTFRYKGCHPIFMQSRPPWTLPAFCCLSETGAVDLLWVHPRARRRGFASAFLHQLDVTQAGVILPESKGFWDKHPQVKYSCVCDLLERNTEPTCNHWALTGIPLVGESYPDVLEGVVHGELDPALTCAVCAKKRTSAKRKKI